MSVDIVVVVVVVDAVDQKFERSLAMLSVERTRQLHLGPAAGGLCVWPTRQVPSVDGRR